MTDERPPSRGGENVTDERVKQIRREHVATQTTWGEPRTICASCGWPWPCAQAYLLARLDEALEGVEDIHTKDRVRTSEHNILVQENRALQAQVAASALSSTPSPRWEAAENVVKVARRVFNSVRKGRGYRGDELEEVLKAYDRAALGRDEGVKVRE